MSSSSALKDPVQGMAAIESLAPLPADIARLDIGSPVFTDHGLLPLQYTFDGADISPSLDISGLPAETKSLALILDDLDAPGRHFIHWLAWNIPPTKHLREARAMEMEGLNDFHTPRYNGPCPDVGAHRYVFHLYALDALLDIPRHSRMHRLLEAIKGHIAGYGNITALYQRK